MAYPSMHSKAGKLADSADLHSRSDDDMIDTSNDFKRWPFLHKVLGGCRDDLINMYKDADKSADTAQREHRRVVWRAASFATAAVCVAIVELGLETAATERHWISWVMTAAELIFVLFALYYFGRGERFREEWLRQRNTAERCRLLKFSTLLQPILWEAPGGLGQDCNIGLGEKIESIKKSNLEKWLKEDELPSPPGRTHGPEPNVLAALRGYYLNKRLRYQREHFAKRSARKESKRDRRSRVWPERLFRSSVVLVLAHALFSGGIAIYGHHVKVKDLELKYQNYLIGLAVSAAILPTIGAGIHSWRSAWEGTRNISRFRAKAIALENIEARLSKNKEILKDEDAEELIRDIWCAEQIMESEHREWLRLMKDAEWAG